MGLIPPEPPIPPVPAPPPPGVRPPPPPPPPVVEPPPPDDAPAVDIAAVLAPLASGATAPQRKTPLFWKRLWITLGVDVPDYLQKSARHRRGIRNIGA